MSYCKPLSWKFEKGRSTLVNGAKDRDLNCTENYCYDEENLLGVTYDSDEDDDMPIVDQSSGSGIILCGAMTGVPLIHAGFMKRTSIVMKNAKHVQGGSENRTYGETDDEEYADRSAALRPYREGN